MQFRSFQTRSNVQLVEFEEVKKSSRIRKDVVPVRGKRSYSSTFASRSSKALHERSMGTADVGEQVFNIHSVGVVDAPLELSEVVVGTSNRADALNQTLTSLDLDVPLSVVLGTVGDENIQDSERNTPEPIDPNNAIV